ncbi:glycine betaine/L-proline ABC transporter ATP-binding protein, partial [Streptococcus agalactiae]
MTNILEVKNLTKIFGKKQKAALEMVKQGISKKEILEKTGATVVFYDASC